MASLSQNTSGNWRAQVEVRGQREYKTFRLKSLAQQWAKQRESELERGLLASVDAAQKNTLLAIIDRYRERVLPHKRNRSDRFTLNLLEAEFGRYRLISLQSRDIADFRDRRLQAGKAPATVVKELNLFRVLIDYAINDMGIYLPANPARMVKNPTVRNSRDRILRPAEEKQLFEAFSHPMLPAHHPFSSRNRMPIERTAQRKMGTHSFARRHIDHSAHQNRRPPHDSAQPRCN